ncbi:pyridoxal-phosphate dependent enzyme [Clostridium sp. 'deep sea']|uniref:1-aminocyclopropane-1-carboxylate deaminase/D-cysteine desulfhydrase n=1 Tax=Clostridium sp. 'deep sea' TaxID=2779445 RepID=UPI0018965E23|nr:pyridoxal-phosphate dependent enzyme [Clostridium sp. 'deep sea']QOR35209.1 pyridoxal-phosphate dependent enzyme [Clostridium sp. 'deep sea']
MKFEAMKKVDMNFGRTPIHRLNNLEKKLNGINLYLKRDDIGGYGVGGNKLRKLEYLVQDALNKGATLLLTYGGIQTNHGRLTAAAARKFGLKCGIIMKGNPPNELSGNLLLDKLMGADLHFIDDRKIKNEANYKEKYTELYNKTLQTVIDNYEQKGEKVYYIPLGGSNNIGFAGYINVAREIKTQMQDMETAFDYVVTAYGSGGTFGGLLLGSKYFKCGFKTVGISVLDNSEENLAEDIKLFNDTSKFYEMGIKITREDVWFEKKYLGKGYNEPDKAIRDVIYTMAREEAVILDPCYTGKAFLGLMDMINNKAFKEGSNILFIHTGGMPGNYSKSHLAEFNKDLWGSQQVY